MDQADIIWPRDALPKGADLNGYRIDAVIGRGGFGITYRATDGIDQVFAVKECFPKQFAVRQGNQVLPSDHESTDPFNECLTRFGGEARALRQLATIGAAGDGVVKVMTFFQANGTAYVIMEFLAGDSLDRVIKSQKSGIDPAQLDFIVPRLLHATACVHSAGLLHRDIKPANIILRDDGRPVLIDFGAARTASHGRTITFTQIFSEGYAPIEQFAGTRQGPFSDIYALGATFYRAIGGTAVDSFTRHQALLRGKRDPQPPATQVGTDRYSPSLLFAIDSAMVVAPEERPQSVAELLALLQSVPVPNATIICPRPIRPAAVMPKDASTQNSPMPAPDPMRRLPPQGTSPVPTARSSWDPERNHGFGSLGPKFAVVVSGMAFVAFAILLYSQLPVSHSPSNADPAPPSNENPKSSVLTIAPGEHPGLVAAYNVQLRLAPNDTATTRAWVDPGEPVAVQQQAQVGSQTWLLVRTATDAGWVPSQFISLPAAAQRANQARAAAQALRARATTAITELGLSTPSLFADVDTLFVQAQQDLSNNEFDTATEKFTKASALITTDAVAFLGQQAAEYASLSQRKLHAGDLAAAQSALNLAKKITQAKAKFQ